ncbi:MAG: cyclic-di-AMP receptor [Firmicutes bacterium]|nr:cyclic-di-AMP receptor [Bacillota bacterium]
MKMIIAIVQNSDVHRLSEGLVKTGVRVTKLASTGGFLRAGNTTFMIGVEDARVEDVLAQIKKGCQPREEYTPPFTTLENTDPFNTASDETAIPYSGSVQVGGATVFILPIERFVRY